MKVAVVLKVIRRAAGSQRAVVSGLCAIALSGALVGAEAAQKSVRSDVAAIPEGPLVVVVSLGSQRMALYDKNGRVLESPVSSGQFGHETPEGVFTVIERQREHFSNLYDDAPMPNMQRITWSGIALHAGHLPGYPASHGCIRMPYGVSERMFELTKLGTRVVVTSREAAPVAFEHPRLFTGQSDEPSLKVAAAAMVPTSDAIAASPVLLGAAVIDHAPASALPPLNNPFADRPAGVSRAAWAAELTGKAQQDGTKAKTAKAQADAAARDAERAFDQVLAAERSRSALSARAAALEDRIAASTRPTVQARLTQERDAVLARLATVHGGIDALRAAEEEKRNQSDLLAAEAAAADDARVASGVLARDATRALKPVSVFVSRKSGRLYVRQGFQPLFDIPVAIADPRRPIGTHVYTALDSKPGSDAMIWSALTTVGDDQDAVVAPLRRARKNQQAAPAVPRPRLTAAAALDRVDIPSDVRQRVGQLMVPGSSLIISDADVSNETGKGTDFVILTD